MGFWDFLETSQSKYISPEGDPIETNRFFKYYPVRILPKEIISGSINYYAAIFR